VRRAEGTRFVLRARTKEQDPFVPARRPTVPGHFSARAKQHARVRRGRFFRFFARLSGIFAVRGVQ
jgi:hypothetical protein